MLSEEEHVAFLASGEINVTRLKSLLMVSKPTRCEDGMFRLRLARATILQPFGIAFRNTADRLTIAQDYPHLWLRKNDIVVSIDGQPVSSMVSPSAHMKSPLLMNLVILRMGSDAVVQSKSKNRVESGVAGFLTRNLQACVAPHNKDNDACLEKAVMETLLAVKPPILIDADKGEFQVTVQRSSRHQEFGLVFITAGSGDGPNSFQGACVLMEDRLPFALRRGDRLVTIDGMDARNMTADDCALHASKALKLVLTFWRPSGVTILCDEDIVGLEEQALLEYDMEDGETAGSCELPESTCFSTTVGLLSPCRPGRRW
eukprot:TRINITY_DN54509_c0_g1_i1.p1 TRINITY_DN54509_c0_g1~~TRINITY_DN54509_c0_g1_i1.p1  ORF type:complete len:316 (-),score=46.56 TRINITY_DN54509_c0_g1_i1:36-983(-)